MKKLYVGSVLITILLCSLLITKLYQRTDYLRLSQAEWTEQSFVFYVPQQVALETDEWMSTLEDISNDYRVSIVKIDDVADGSRTVLLRSLVLYEETFPTTQLQLANGRLLMTDDETVSTPALRTQQTVGILHDFAQDDFVRFQTLRAFFRDPKNTIEGVYRVVSTQAVDQMGIVSRLAQRLQVPDDQLTETSVSSAVGFNPLVYVAAVFGVLVSGVALLICVVYPIFYGKEIGAQRLLGYRYSETVASFLQPLYEQLLVATFVGDALLIWLVQPLEKGYLIQLFSSQVAILIVTFGVASLSLWLVSRTQLSLLLKNTMNLKFVMWCVALFRIIFSVIVVVFVAYAGFVGGKVWRQWQLHSQWHTVNDMLVMNRYEYVRNEATELRTGSHALAFKVSGMHQDLVEQLNAYYIRPQQLSSQHLSEWDHPLMDHSKFNSGKQYDLMLVNRNYLQDFPVFDDQGQPLIIPDTGATRLYVLPESYRNDSQIYYLLQAYLWGNVRSGQRILGQEPSEVAIDQTEIQILYYDDIGTPRFSFDQRSVEAGHAYFSEPIFEVVSDHMLSATDVIHIENSGLANPWKIPFQPDVDKKLEEIIVAHQLHDNRVQFVPIRQVIQDDERRIMDSLSQIGVLLLSVSLLNLLAVYFLMRTMALSRKKEVFVQRLLGYTLYHRYKLECHFLVVLYAAQLAVIAVQSRNVVTIAVQATLIALDFIVVTWILRRWEQRNLSALLKGEE